VSEHRSAEPDDVRLLAACRRGERAAIERVLLAHVQMLESMLARIVGPRADVEELLQQTFAEAIVSFPKFRGDARVGTWLTSIAIHVAHRALRSPSRRRVVALELIGEVAGERAQPDEEAHRRRAAERLYAVLDEIAPKKRLAFVLHALEDRPIDEVASLMGASRTATKSRVFWARRELVRRFERDPVLREFVAKRGVER
jgi:RNA polymerase sigma-70 factor (ECF subfamily)